MPTDFTPSNTTFPTLPIELPNNGEVWDYTTVMQDAGGDRGPVAKAIEAAFWCAQYKAEVAYKYHSLSSPASYGTSWTNVVEDTEDIKVSYSNVKSGDRVILFAQAKLTLGGGEQARIRFGNTVTGINAVSSVVQPATTQVNNTIVGIYPVIATAATIDLFLQVQAVGAYTVELYQDVFVGGLLLRSRI